MLDDQFLHDSAHRFRVDMAIDRDHWAFEGVLVEDRQLHLNLQSWEHVLQVISLFEPLNYLLRCMLNYSLNSPQSAESCNSYPTLFKGMAHIWYQETLLFLLD